MSRSSSFFRAILGFGRPARVVLEAWRIEFRTEHPHSSLGYLTPAQFAASWGAA